MIDLGTVTKLHNATTLFHAFIYFAPEAAAEYAALGVQGRGQYFGSRGAAMGAASPELVLATFYNFSPDAVIPAMEDLWNETSPEEMQLARWNAAAAVLEGSVGELISESELDEAISIASEAVDGVSWEGRPLAAANAAQMPHFDRSVLSASRLVRLWQLATILREWRGDAHIAILVTEPLDGAECSVVTALTAGYPDGIIRRSRKWSDPDWNAAIGRLSERGWVDDDGAITALGRSSRAALEHRTNELSTPLVGAVGEEAALRLCDLLERANQALRQANYFAALGQPAR